MKLFFDRRLGYFVAAPGQETPLASLAGKAGDSSTEVIVQFGQSSDPTSSTSIISAPTWTAENLTAGTNITIGLKADGDYSDGDILASASSFTHNSTDKLYTFSLSLNTEAIDTALGRGDPLEDDIESVLCNFELTYQVGGSGGWKSSVLNVPFTIYHDVLYGDEGTPTNADDPTEYALTQDTIVWLPSASSLTGGTSADLDSIPTVSLTAGHTIGLYDTDPATDVVRFYRLTAGTDAESAPDVIRPDDYATTTNEKVWKLLPLASTGINAVVDDTTPQAGGNFDMNGFNLDFDDNTGIRDDSGNEQLTFQKTASAVNQFDITNAATGGGPTLSATGDDTNIDINLAPKGTGVVKAGGTAVVVNPMTTAGDIIKGGTSGAPERLAVGSNGNVLTVVSGAPAWSAPASSATLPITAHADATGNFTLLSSHDGDLLSLDTSGGNVDCLIDDAGTEGYASNMHFWILHRYSGNTATLTPDTGVTINDSASAVTLTAGVVYHLWHRSTDDWLILSY